MCDPREGELVPELEVELAAELDNSEKALWLLALAEWGGVPPVIGGGEGGGFGRAELDCFVLIHSGPKCMVVDI